ncbi:MAG: DUF86 domain-containing protein [Thermoplasmatota archaeon]
MDKERLLRYKEKISVIAERRDNIRSWIVDDDVKSNLAVYKAYQEMIEALTDIFAMMLKDMGGLVEDDYSNIEKMEDKGLLDDKQEGLLKEANGLRNRLVHEYNGIEKKIAMESIKRINSQIEEILEDVRGWIKKP